MGSRIYDRTLACGCMVSTDAGGLLIPCSDSLPPYSNDKENNAHIKAWEDWKKSEDYKLYLSELELKENRGHNHVG